MADILLERCRCVAFRVNGYENRLDRGCAIIVFRRGFHPLKRQRHYLQGCGAHIRAIGKAEIYQAIAPFQIVLRNTKAGIVDQVKGAPDICRLAIGGTPVGRGKCLADQ